MSDFSAFCISENEAFEEATNFVRSGNFDISTEHQLKFYAYFKQATVGPCNTPKPGFFAGFSEGPKWNAWKEVENMSQSEAKLQYVTLLDTLQPEWKSGKATGKKPTWTVHSTMGQAESEGIADADKTICDRVSDEDVAAVTVLLQKDPTLVNFKDDEGRTGLHWAADTGNAELTALFLKYGANPNAQDTELQTPLHYACICEYEEIAKLLVANGADLNIKDKDGQSPSDISAEQCQRALNNKMDI